MAMNHRPVGTDRYVRRGLSHTKTTVNGTGMNLYYSLSIYGKRGYDQFMKWFMAGNTERIEKEIPKHRNRADSQFASATREYSRGFLKAVTEKM